MSAEQQRGRGRPKIGAPLTVRISDDTRRRLNARADDEQAPVAEIARRILDEHA